MSDMWRALAAPFPPSAVSWRAQNVSFKDNKYSALALAYIDARDVMERLDSVCGPANWSDSYTEAATGRVICTIAVKIGDEWVSKSDGAGNTDIEGDKGGISDAFKRAAVKWGIGRYLYSISSPWAACEGQERGGKHYWRKWTPEGRKKLDQVLEAHLRQFQQAGKGQSQTGTVSPSPISKAQADELGKIADEVAADKARFCEHFGIRAMVNLPADRFDEAKTMLERKRQKVAA